MRSSSSSDSISFSAAAMASALLVAPGFFMSSSSESDDEPKSIPPSPGPSLSELELLLLEEDEEATGDFAFADGLLAAGGLASSSESKMISSCFEVRGAGGCGAPVESEDEVDMCWAVWGLSSAVLVRSNSVFEFRGTSPKHAVHHFYNFIEVLV